MSTNTESKSNRDRYSQRLKEKFPDREFPDDEAVFGQINEDYDNYDRQLSEYQGREKQLSDMFTKDPRSAAFMTNWMQGKDPIIESIRQFGSDFTEALQDPEKQEKLAEANKEYAARIAKEKEFEDIYQKNISESLATFESMQQKEGFSDEQLDEAFKLLVTIIEDGILGKFSPESIHMALKAINHDSDVQQADHEGETRGKNTKIEEKLRKAARGDGTANLAGKNGGGGTQRADNMPDLGAIENNYGATSIWDRGGEKRKKN